MFLLSLICHAIFCQQHKQVLGVEPNLNGSVHYPNVREVILATRDTILILEYPHAATPQHAVSFTHTPEVHFSQLVPTFESPKPLCCHARPIFVVLKVWTSDYEWRVEHHYPYALGVKWQFVRARPLYAFALWFNVESPSWLRQAVFVEVPNRIRGIAVYRLSVTVKVKYVPDDLLFIESDGAYRSLTEQRILSQVKHGAQKPSHNNRVCGAHSVGDFRYIHGVFVFAQCRWLLIKSIDNGTAQTLSR